MVDDGEPQVRTVSKKIREEKNIFKVRKDFPYEVSKIYINLVKVRCWYFPELINKPGTRLSISNSVASEGKYELLLSNNKLRPQWLRTLSIINVPHTCVGHLGDMLS